MADPQKARRLQKAKKTKVPKGKKYIHEDIVDKIGRKNYLNQPMYQHENVPRGKEIIKGSTTPKMAEGEFILKVDVRAKRTNRRGIFR